MPYYAPSSGSSSSTAGSTRAYLGAPAQLVAYRAAHPMNLTNNTTLADMNTRLKHVAAADCAQIRLVYSSFNANIAAASNPAELEPAQNITIKAAIELASGTIVPVYFGGSRTYALKPGEHIVSDPVGVNFADGDSFWSRTYVKVTVGDQIPRNLTTNSSKSEGVVTNTTGSDDRADSGTISDSTSLGYGPNAVLGHAATTIPSVAILGDSIAAGQGETLSDWGFIIRAFEDQFAYVRGSRGGDQAQYFASAVNSKRRRVLNAMAKYAICEYGTNDFYVSGRTAAQLQQDLVTCWLACKRSGATVYQTTLLPRTTSSDSWATTGNQSTIIHETKRTATNDWIRAGAPIDSSTLAPVAVGTSGALLAGVTGHPLKNYIETADTVETSRNSGIWQAPSYTADGIHPSPTGHAAMAAVIPTGSFT